MATNNLWDVVYELQDHVMRRDLVMAATGDAPTIAGVLNGNGKSNKSGTSGITITSIRPAGTCLS